MKYTNIVDEIVKEAVKNLAIGDYCKLPMSKITNEVKRIYNERGMNSFITKGISASIGRAMSRLGYIRYHDLDTRYWIIDKKVDSKL